MVSTARTNLRNPLLVGLLDRMGLGIGLQCVMVLHIGTDVVMGHEKSTVAFEVVGQEPPAHRYQACRTTLVGPNLNQPEKYDGYNGFVGWAGVTRLRQGRWIVTFTSGLWHATLPWTEEVRRDPASR